MSIREPIKVPDRVQQQLGTFRRVRNWRTAYDRAIVRGVLAKIALEVVAMNVNADALIDANAGVA